MTEPTNQATNNTPTPAEVAAAVAAMREPFAGVRIKLSLTCVLRAAVFMAKNDIRYYLNGVFVEPVPGGGGVVIVATNGHALGACVDKDGTIDGPGSVRQGFILHLAPSFMREAAVWARANSSGRSRHKMGPDGARLVVEGQRLSISPGFGYAGSDMEAYIQPGRCQIEGRFPNWGKAVPDFESLERGSLAAFNSALLALLEKVPKVGAQPFSVRAEHTKELVFWSKPEAKGEHAGALVVQYPGIPEMFAVVMPMRASDMDSRQGKARLIDLLWPAVESNRLKAAKEGLDKKEARRAADKAAAEGGGVVEGHGRTTGGAIGQP